MPLSLKSTVKNLLKARDLRPSQRLGQNFLIDKGAVKKIIATADLKPEDTVLEIGPGLGVLTQELAKRTKRVIAVEKDPNLTRILNDELRIKNIKNVEIIQGDILKIENWKLIGNWKLEIGNYKVVANLPFYLTAPAIRHFLEDTRVLPVYMTLVVQKEVAQRICSKPPDMSLLAVSVQFYAEPKIISYISRKSFWPQPEVDAAIIKLEIRNLKLEIDAKVFFRVVKAGFSQPRKHLANNLSRGLNIDKDKIGEWILKNNIRTDQRAETLNIEDWIKLTKSFKIN